MRTGGCGRRCWWGGWALSGTMVLFVFMNTMGGAGSLADLRQLGILARARTTPASTGAIAVGYGLGMTSYAIVQAAVMLGTGRLLFGLTWADWPAFLLGGCLWPLELVGPALARAGHLTPHAWALEALRDVGVGGDSLAQVAPRLVPLVAMTVALVAFGALRLRRITTAAQG